MNKNILDNEFVGIEKNYQDDLTRFDRLGAMFTDHLITTFIFVMIFIIPFSISLRSGFDVIGEIILYLIFSIYLNKDCLNGRSIAKRLNGQIVISSKSKSPANEYKCLIRNLMIPFWLIEGIAIIIKPNRRIGDFIAKTKVVRIRKDNLSNMYEEFKDANKLNIVICLFLGFIYIAILIEIKNRLFSI